MKEDVEDVFFLACCAAIAVLTFLFCVGIICLGAYYG